MKTKTETQLEKEIEKKRKDKTYKYRFNVLGKIDGRSPHHIFDYYEVREKIIDLFGEPKTDEEHKNVQKEVKKCMNVIPVYLINWKKHNQIHKSPNNSHLSVKSRIKKAKLSQHKTDIKNFEKLIDKKIKYWKKEKRRLEKEKEDSRLIGCVQVHINLLKEQKGELKNL